MMKPAVLSFFIVLGLAILASAFWLGTRWYGVIDAIQGVNVLYSDNEIFVFVGHGKAVLAGARIRLIAEDLTSVLHIPDHVGDDLLVAHFKDGKLSTNDLKGFGYFGAPFAYQGQGYWYLGISNIWKLDGSNVISLSMAETALLVGQIKDIDTVTRAEGWDRNFFHTSWEKPEAIIHLRSGDVKVYADVQPLANGRNYRVRVMLAQIGKTNPPETLIDIVEGYQKISKEKHLKLKAQKKSN
jgi:hypothetical protein